jgi:hypothetical protein
LQWLQFLPKLTQTLLACEKAITYIVCLFTKPVLPGREISHAHPVYKGASLLSEERKESTTRTCPEGTLGYSRLEVGNNAL